MANEGWREEQAAVEAAEVMAEVRGRLNLRARFNANREQGQRLVWQEANAQARQGRDSWAECCGRPTSTWVIECHDCALAREREEEETARVIAVERAKDAARSEWIA